MEYFGKMYSNTALPMYQECWDIFSSFKAYFKTLLRFSNIKMQGIPDKEDWEPIKNLRTQEPKEDPKKDPITQDLKEKPITEYPKEHPI